MSESLKEGYHVVLNGHGFVLLDESYQRGAQKPFNPRFSTGDPSVGDLSYWQFLSQEDWGGGSGQNIFSDKTKYRKAPGWDIKDGRPRLAFKPAAVTLANAAVAVAAPSFGCDFFIFNGDVFIFYGSSGSAGTRTVLVDASAANNLPKITHINLAHAVAFYRGTDGVIAGGTEEHYLGGITSTGVVIYDADFNSEYSADLRPAGLGTVGSGVFIPIDSLRALAVAQTFDPAGNDYLTFVRYQWGAGDWVSGGSSLGSILDRAGTTIANPKVVPSFAKDSDGTIYFGVVAFDTNVPRMGTKIYQMTAADAIAANPLVSAVHSIDEFVLSGFHEYGGVVYLLGMQLDEDGGRVQIRKLNGSVIWESTKLESVNVSGGEKLAIIPHHSSLGKLLFVCRTDDDSYNVVYQMNENEKVQSVAAFNWTPASSTDRASVLFASGSYYFFTSGAGTVTRTKFTRGQLELINGQSYPADLELSEMGANTPLIEKTLYSVTIELSSATPAGHPIDILINDEKFGSIENSDGTSKEIIAEADFTATSFIPKIQTDSQSDWSGHIKRISLRYLPTQFKKKQFGMAFRIENNQALLNGQRERRTVDEMIVDIETAWTTKQPVKYIDIDGTEYKVIVSDYKLRVPVVADQQGKREAVCVVELLQV